MYFNDISAVADTDVFQLLFCDVCKVVDKGDIGRRGIGHFKAWEISCNVQHGLSADIFAVGTGKLAYP